MLQDRLLTPADLAELIGKTERWVKAHTTEGEPSRDQIRGVRFGDAWRYTVDAVDDYIARRRAAQTVVTSTGDEIVLGPRSKRSEAAARRRLAHIQRLATEARSGRR